MTLLISRRSASRCAVHRTRTLTHHRQTDHSPIQERWRLNDASLSTWLTCRARIGVRLRDLDDPSRPAGGGGLNLLLLSFRLASELHPNIEGSTGRSKRALSLAAQVPSMHLCPHPPLPSGPTAEDAGFDTFGPTGCACIEARAAAAAASMDIVHSLIVRHTSHIVRSMLVCQNGICRPACR